MNITPSSVPEAAARDDHPQRRDGGRAFGTEQMSETSPAPVVEVRERRIAADLNEQGKPTTTLTQYHVIVDGRRVDSFLTRGRAERAALALRALTK